MVAAGKSTFSQALVQGSTLPFVRVNQDTIRRDGTPGTRKQCVTAARNALMSGKSVVVDRCVCVCVLMRTCMDVWMCAGMGS